MTGLYQGPSQRFSDTQIQQDEFVPALCPYFINTIDQATISHLLERIPTTTLNPINDGNVREPQSTNAHIYTLSGNYSTPLDPKFVRVGKPRTFFVPGRVFRVLWAQPAGERTPPKGSAGRRRRSTGVFVPNDNKNIWIGNRGERVFQEVKIFVVVRVGYNYCTAVQITSYSGQGVGKYDVLKSEHAIAYTGDVPPGALPTERPIEGEAGMLPIAIRIIPDVVDGNPLYLKQPSRINFGKQYTIEHNIKVQSFGLVDQASLQTMIHQFLTVHHPHWESDLSPTSSLQMPHRRSNRSEQSSGGFDSSPPTSIYKLIYGTGAKELQGAPEYKVRSGEFYREGKVFTILGCKESSPAFRRRDNLKGKCKSLPSIITEDVEGVDENEVAIISQRRWFIVIKPGRSSSLCLRILSYENQGSPVGHANSEHSPVHTGKKRPKISKSEFTSHGDKTTMKEAIRIIQEDRATELLPTHLIRYSTLYRVHHDVFACPFGHVHEHFNWYLKEQTKAYFRSLVQDCGIPASEAHRELWTNSLEQLSSSESDECNGPEDADSFVLRSDIPAPDHKGPAFKEGDRVLLPGKDKPNSRAKFRPLRIKEARLVPSSWRWKYKLKYEKHEGEFASGRLFPEEALIDDPVT